MQGRDKGLVKYRGQPLVEHIIARVAPQTDDIVISANRNLERYAGYGYPVCADHQTGYAGPLAGIASCLPECQHELALVVACDMPCLPNDLSQRLLPRVSNQGLAVATSEGRQQLALLISVQLQAALELALAQHQHRLMDWIADHDATRVEFADAAAFTNLNTLYDLGDVS